MEGTKPGNGVPTERGDARVASVHELKLLKEKAAIARGNKTLAIMFIGLVLDLLAFTMILPLMPAILDYYGQHDKGGLYFTLKDSVRVFREYVGAPDTPRWNGVLFGGLIGSLFSFLQFLASPLIGAASDVYGRKVVLIISTIGVSLSYVVWALSSNFTLFVFARVIGGFSKGNVSLSTAMVADILPPEKRGRGMALVGAAFSVGFIVGPMIGAGFSYILRTKGEAFFIAPALFAIFLSVINIIFLAALLPETLPQAKRASSLSASARGAVDLINPSSLFQFSALKGLKSKDLKTVQSVGQAYFLYLFLYSGLEFTLTFLTHIRFRYDSMLQGRMFLFIGILMIFVQGGYVRRLEPGCEHKFIIKGMMMVIPAFVVIGLAYNEIFLYIGLLLFAFGSATVVPCMTTVVVSYGGAEQKGTILGIFRSLGALARATGPVITCTVYWCFGAEVCYILGSIALIIPLFMVKRLKSSVHED